MHADLEKLIELKKITKELAEKLDQYSPGHFLLHKSWGVGKVSSWNLPKNQIVIDFEAKPAYEMEFKFAVNLLTPLLEGNILIECFEQPESLKKLALKDRSELMRKVLISHGNAIRPEDVERILRGRIIEDTMWKKWWDKTREVLRGNAEFILPAKKGDMIQLRAEKLSSAEALLNDYQLAKDLKTCVRLLDSAKLATIIEDTEVTEQLLVIMEEDIKKSGRSVLQYCLELCILRDEMIALLPAAITAKLPARLSLEDLVSSLKLEDIINVIASLPVQHQRKLYEVFPAIYEDKWLPYVMNIFLFGGARAVGEAAKFILEKGCADQLYLDVRNGIMRQNLSPDVLIWVCRERKGDSKPLFSLALGSAVLAVIDKESLDGGVNRALRLKALLTEDKTLVQDLVASGTLLEARPFAKSLYQCPALLELDRKLLLSNMMKEHPELQEIALDGTPKRVKRHFYVSQESFDARKAELEELRNVKIPQNKIDLATTRAEGDLRENGGYEDAKQTRNVLSRRRMELERGLAEAEVTDFSSVDGSVVAMGTSVVLVDAKGKESPMTILGAWDSNPEKQIVSYLSKVGKHLIGHQVGETVSLVTSGEEEQAYTIKSITPVVKA